MSVVCKLGEWVNHNKLFVGQDTEEWLDIGLASGEHQKRGKKYTAQVI